MTARACCLIALFAVCVPPAAQAAQDDTAAVPRISVADMQKGVAAGTLVIVDVRDPASFAGGHIPGALSIPLQDVAKKVAELKALKKTIVAYCA